MAYKAYVVLVDEDYPMPEGSMGAWEGGWWPVDGYTWPNDELENAEWFAGYVAQSAKEYLVGEKESLTC